MQVLTTEAKVKINKYRDEFLVIFPNTKKDESGDFVYTDAEWIDEVVKDWLTRQIQVGSRRLQEAEIVESNFTI